MRWSPFAPLRLARQIEIDAIPIVDYTHLGAMEQLSNAAWVSQKMQSRYHVDEDGCTIFVHYTFLQTSDLPPGVNHHNQTQT